jgi:hypothetical protein
LTTLLTANGLAIIDDAFNVFGIPFSSIRSGDAPCAGTPDPMLAARLESKRFHLLAWGEGGWVQLFSTAVANPGRCERVKLFSSGATTA